MIILYLFLFSQSTTVSITADNLFASDVLLSISRQSGIRCLLDLDRPADRVNLRLDKCTTWNALDQFTRSINAKILLDRNSIRIVSRRPGESLPPTAYDGSYRARVLRVQGHRDLITNSRSCTLSLEVGWLPNLVPIFLDSGPNNLLVYDMRGQPILVDDPSTSLIPIEGRSTVTLDLVLPGFPRSDASIGKLSGKLNLVVLGEMLTFDFDSALDVLQVAPPSGSQRRTTQNQVTANVVGLTLGRDRWTVKMSLDYPRGANREFESFQAGSMVMANELRLISLDGKRQLVPSATVTEEIGTRRTVVSFHFTDGATMKRGAPAGWKIRYQAPARVVDSSFKFSFDNIPLP
ncbi:MAG: hypothetical protein EBV06_04815 [Planctomycetia bacterium]|nr:hypothetical protein [Planctomycetia bacterium]